MKKISKRITFLTVLLIFVVMAIYIMAFKDVPFLDIPFVKSEQMWSIGIYTGKDPLLLKNPPNVINPVLSAADVNDVPAEFVADPFMVYEKGVWYMFFEVLNFSSNQGDIAFATSLNGLQWRYGHIVLNEPFHLSYPYVFKWKNDYYMICEGRESSSVRLYRASKFPEQWEFVRTLIFGDYADPSILRYNGKWWLFAQRGYDTLTLHYARDLTGHWTEHPLSPIVKRDENISRPGGRLIVYKGTIIRFTQDDYPTYGNQIRAFQIDTLTTTDYKEHELMKSPVLKASGSGWNAEGMHTIDPHRIGKNRWIACVDGLSSRRIVFHWN